MHNALGYLICLHFTHRIYIRVCVCVCACARARVYFFSLKIFGVNIE
jgi:hypothetical protein